LLKNKIYSNQYVISSIILLFLNLTSNSCYSLRESGKIDDGVIKYYKIELINGEIIDFQNTKLGYGFKSGDKIVSISKYGEIIEIPLSEVKTKHTKKFDYGNTFFLGVGIAAGLFLILIGIIAIGMEGRSFGG